LQVFCNITFFLKNYKELPLVAFIIQEKIAIQTKKLSITVWAKKSIKNIKEISFYIAL
jgi:hypothetical protein